MSGPIQFKGLVACICILSSGAAANAEQFSITCEQAGWHFMTFDTRERKVVYETPARRALKGQITAESDNEIRFSLLQMGSPNFDVIWNRADGILTWIGLPNDPSRPTATIDCSKTELRPVLRKYDNIPPMK
jgi:hypothetical protein